MDNNMASGVTAEKISPILPNTCKYRPIPDNGIVRTLVNYAIYNSFELPVLAAVLAASHRTFEFNTMPDEQRHNSHELSQQSVPSICVHETSSLISQELPVDVCCLP